MGTSLLCDTLSSYPSSTRARPLHRGLCHWNLATEPTSTWQDKSPYIRWRLLRQAGRLALEETPQRAVHVQEPSTAALHQGKGATARQDSTEEVDTPACGMPLPRAGTLPLHRKSFCRKAMAYLWRTRLKCQRGSSRRQCSPVLSVERTVGHQERLFLSFFCFHMTKLCDPMSSAFPEHVTVNACTYSSWDLSDCLRNGGEGGSPVTVAGLWPDLA